jgi:hypothetical protein
MEGRRNHRNRVVALTVTALLLVHVEGAAQELDLPPIGKAERTATVYTTPDRAVVEAELTAAQGPSAKVATKRSGRSCRLEPDTAPVTSGNLTLYNAHRDDLSYSLVCDGQWMGLVWIPSDPGPRRAPSPSGIRDAAMRLREEIPMPTVTIGVNPAGIGLVGIEAWFWIEGYRGEVISHPSSAFGIPVEVEAHPTSYRWNFGDGTVAEASSLGKPYPQPSDIRHTYERSSTGFPSGFPLDVEFNFDVRYRLAGGPWIDLTPISRSARIEYPVRESQAVITR